MILDPSREPLVRSLGRPGTLIVLDFDGTLAPIVSDRRSAGLSARTRTILRRLARLYPVAVLSGRSAEDVRVRLAGVDARWVVGSHGVEWPGDGRHHRARRNLVSRWRATLTQRLAGVQGVELEAKPLSLTIHYRRATHPRRALALIRQAVGDLPGASLILGKKVVNLVPEGAGDKGTALRRLVGLAEADRVLFVGDDVTDEAAFGVALDIPAVMVRVGRHPESKADRWLRRRADVDVLLERLCRLREPGPTASARTPRAAQGNGAQVEQLGPILGFMKDLWALEQGLNQRSKAMLDRHGVSGPQSLVVRVVGRLGPISPAQLARVLHLHPSSVTRLIRRLEKRHVISRTPQPGHRGRFLLELGSRGDRVERLVPGTVEGAVRASLGVAQPQDVAATRRVLALLTRRLAATR